MQRMPSSLFKGKETPGHPRQSSESTGMMGKRKQDSSVGNAVLGSNLKKELNPCLLTSLVPDRQKLLKFHDRRDECFLFHIHVACQCSIYDDFMVTLTGLQSHSTMDSRNWNIISILISWPLN